MTVLASTTATYGRSTAPAIGIRIHQPRLLAKTAAIRKQMSRMTIAIVYLSMRVLRSASGEGGSDVADWIGCFFIVTLQPTSPCARIRLVSHYDSAHPSGYPR